MLSRTFSIAFRYGFESKYIENFPSIIVVFDDGAVEDNALFTKEVGYIAVNLETVPDLKLWLLKKQIE